MTNTVDTTDIEAIVKIRLCGVPLRNTLGNIEYLEIVQSIIEDAIGYCDDGIEIQSVQEIHAVNTHGYSKTNHREEPMMIIEVETGKRDWPEWEGLGPTPEMLDTTYRLQVQQAMWRAFPNDSVIVVVGGEWRSTPKVKVSTLTVTMTDVLEGITEEGVESQVWEVIHGLPDLQWWLAARHVPVLLQNVRYNHRPLPAAGRASGVISGIR